MKSTSSDIDISQVSDEQLPVAKHKLKGWKHFMGLYAGEHVAATEFVFGATFVALGATMTDILLGLLIGNLLAVLSWTLITTPIAVDTRLSLYSYLQKIAGDSMTKLYNWANVIIFTVISAAMITVSATAVRFALNIPAQLNWYPTNLAFVAVVLAVGVIVVFVAMYGFNAVSNFSRICAPWLFTMFICGPLILMPALAESVIGQTFLTSWNDFIHIGSTSVWTGFTQSGEPGIGLLEVIGFSWAANTITHFGLIDMALLRFAKRKRYGLCTSAGMLFGHYIAWISAGIMGAGTAVIVQKSIGELDPGDVAFHALGLSGLVIVIVAGWTTANANLYRAGLAAQAIFNDKSRTTTTAVVGMVTVAIACFPFVFTKLLPLLTYAGLLVVPVGAIVFAEHMIFPRIGFTRYWAHYQSLTHSTPAVASWGLGLVFGFGLNVLDVMSFYYLFIPTWFFTIAVYTALAAKYGAKQAYPEQEAQVDAFNARVEAHQQQEAALENEHVEDVTAVSKLLRLTSLASLLVSIALAIKTFSLSDTVAAYELNRDLFFNVGFACTVIYFVTAYWAMRRHKALQS
ncbi:membrane protein [Alteromonas macleodii]|uniref:purine-cytosine permease family protein n=1 Tax=Alteromonas macleodii TaxID=28108 RepID=UPI00057F283E|nr:membrane protein [Alteromonas macleodii]KHT59558.1 membrane protein [Alteromonas macleodii]